MPDEAPALNGGPCKAEVKTHTGKRQKCGTFLPKGKPECPNRRDHIWKFKSGHCMNGWCEGTLAKDSADKYVRTCHLWMTCNCDCHTKLDQMFILTEQERILIENPKYVKPKSGFVLPNRMLEEFSGPAIPAPVSLLNANTSKHFHDTASGKRARGQLENEVLTVCKQFVSGQIEVEVLTPAVIALEIDEVEPPSVGAIGAVFDRWTSIKFAVCEKSPVRFTSFTADGLQFGLENMKANAKRDQKMKQAERSRSLRR